MPDIALRKKKVWYYIPYASIICFTSQMIGLGVWDSYSHKVLATTDTALKALSLRVEADLVWGKSAVVLTTAVTVILGLFMVALGTGRSVIAYQADRTGATRMGGRLISWMWMCAVFIIFWWLLTVWFVLLLLGELLWSAAAWAITSAAKVGAQVSASIPPSQAIIVPAIKGNSTCSTACVDLSTFDFALGNSTCLCDLKKIEVADDAMQIALDQMKGSIVGAVLMVLAGGWVLMVAAAEFGVTRRERQLLRRIAKARMAQGENTKLLNGSDSSSGPLGKMKKSKSKSGTKGQQLEVIVDQETGEVLEVEMSGASQAVESDGGGGGKGGGGGGAGAHRSNSITSMGKSLSKTVAKGLGKSTHVFEVLGGLLSPRMK